MKKLFILFGLFLTLSLSGQLTPGIVESQKVVSTPVGEPEMITNGTFDSGDSWAVTGGWSIGSGVATYSGAGYSYLVQNAADMVSVLETSTDYTLEFDVSSIGVNIRVYSYDNATGEQLIALTEYTTGHYSLDFTSPGTLTRTGIALYATPDLENAATVDNISLKKR